MILALLVLASCSSKKEKNREDNTWTDENVKKLEAIANEAYSKDQYSNAIFLYNKLIGLDSTQGEYYFKRGYSYSMLQNTDNATQDFLRSIRLEYKVSKSYQNIGSMYFALISNDSLAAYYFSKALKYDPTNEKIKNLLEICKKRLNKKTK